MNNKHKTLSKLLRPNKKRADTAIIIFLISLIVNLASGISNLMFYSHYNDATFIELQQIAGSTHLSLIIGFTGLNIFIAIVGVITFLNWFRRAYFNLHLFSENKLSYDEDMAVWSFMIPFINLVRPLAIAKEIYEGYYSKAQKFSQKGLEKNESIIGVWWFLFVVFGVIIGLLSRAGDEETMQQLIKDSLCVGIGELLEIPRLIAAIILIKTISKVESIVYNNRLALDDTALALTKYSSEDE